MFHLHPSRPHPPALDSDVFVSHYSPFPLPQVLEAISPLSNNRNSRSAMGKLVFFTTSGGKVEYLLRFRPYTQQEGGIGVPSKRKSNPKMLREGRVENGESLSTTSVFSTPFCKAK